MTRRPTRLWHAMGLMLVGLAGIGLAGCRVHHRSAPDYYIGPISQAPAKAGDSKSADKVGPPAEGAAAENAVPVPTEIPKGPLDRTMAVLMALANNQALVVERLNPEIVRTREDLAEVPFDPVLTGWFGHERRKGLGITGNRNQFNYATDSIVGEATLAQLFPTGTRVALGASTAVVDKSSDEQIIESRLGMTVTQALLRGQGVDANLASVRQAELDSLASEYQLRGFAAALVARVEEAYWDCMLEKLQASIFRRALEVAELRERHTRERVKAGDLSATEIAAAAAAVARSKERLLNAESNLQKAKLVLLKLMNPYGGHFWKGTIELPDPPQVPNESLEDVETYVQVALRMRPDLNQARLMAERGELEVVRTRNGLLPQLDLFVTFGKTGYAETFGGAWKDVEGDAYDLTVGLSTAFPLKNREARALHRGALLGRRYAREALRNMEQLLQLDVRSAHIEVDRAEKQITATRATLALRQQTLEAEKEKLAIGQSTLLQVDRADRDLVESQAAESEAVIDYLQAFANLYHMDGSLLQRRGIAAPGETPVELKSVGP